MPLLQLHSVSAIARVRLPFHRAARSATVPKRFLDIIKGIGCQPALPSSGLIREVWRWLVGIFQGVVSTRTFDVPSIPFQMPHLLVPSRLWEDSPNRIRDSIFVDSLTFVVMKHRQPYPFEGLLVGHPHSMLIQMSLMDSGNILIRFFKRILCWQGVTHESPPRPGGSPLRRLPPLSQSL